MGCSVVEDNFKDEVKSISYTECFKKYCPIFMSYGLSYDDFWHGDVYKTRYCLKAHKERLRQRDMDLWEQGMYIYEAILQCSPILHPFSKAKEPLPYTEKPHSMLSVQKTEDELLQEQENEKLKAQLWMRNWVRSMKKNK